MNNAIREKLVKAVAAMGNPTKDQRATVPTKSGGQYSYTYAGLPAVLEAVTAALAENGLGLTQGARRSVDGTLTFETAVYDGTGELVLDARPYREYADPQQQGSWETYNRRYALLAAFGLAAEDDDGKAAKEGSRIPANNTSQRPPEPSSGPIVTERAPEPIPDGLKAFTAFKERLARARGVSNKEAADELLAVFGNPRGMDAGQVESFKTNAGVYVAAVERKEANEDD